MKLLSENHSGDVNNDSGRARIFHPFAPGMIIHIAPESLFTSPRNDYSHAPESAPKRLINSNVGIELGYALRALTDKKVLLVFNEHYGNHEDLPFDLRHKGGAIVFRLTPKASVAEIREQRKKLKERFVVALKHVLEYGPLKTPIVSERPSTTSRARLSQ